MQMQKVLNRVILFQLFLENGVERTRVNLEDQLVKVAQVKNEGTQIAVAEMDRRGYTSFTISCDFSVKLSDFENSQHFSLKALFNFKINYINTFQLAFNTFFSVESSHYSLSVSLFFKCLLKEQSEPSLNKCMAKLSNNSLFFYRIVDSSLESNEMFDSFSWALN